MDALPPEMLHIVCGYACTDAGFTARSLSLVSKYIHNVTQPFRYQTIVVSGSRQILKLSSMLYKIPSNQRYIRRCAISESPIHIHRGRVMHHKTSSPSTAPMDDTSRTQAIHNILHAIADTVETLYISSQTAIPDEPLMIFPRLEELTSSGFPLQSQNPSGRQLEDSIFAPCLRLRRLHFTRKFQVQVTGQLLDDIGNLAPSLEYLRFSQMRQLPFRREQLKVALGISKPQCSGIVPQPITLQSVFFQPVRPVAGRDFRYAHRADSHAYFMRGIQRLNKQPDDRVVLLKPLDLREPAYQLHCFEEWWDSCWGGDGCWSMKQRVPRNVHWTAITCEKQ